MCVPCFLDAQKGVTLSSAEAGKYVAMAAGIREPIFSQYLWVLFIFIFFGSRRWAHFFCQTDVKYVGAIHLPSEEPGNCTPNYFVRTLTSSFFFEFVANKRGICSRWSANCPQHLVTKSAAPRRVWNAPGFWYWSLISLLLLWPTSVGFGFGHFFVTFGWHICQCNILGGGGEGWVWHDDLTSSSTSNCTCFGSDSGQCVRFFMLYFLMCFFLWPTRGFGFGLKVGVKNPLCTNRFWFNWENWLLEQESWYQRSLGRK